MQRNKQKNKLFFLVMKSLIDNISENSEGNRAVKSNIKLKSVYRVKPLYLEHVDNWFFKIYLLK
jgi:hypothetical protein